MYSQSLDTLDWIVIGGYFVLLFAVAAWVIMQKQKNSEDYFLAGRNMGWFVVGASIFASNIGSEHVVGLAKRDLVQKPDGFCPCLVLQLMYLLRYLLHSMRVVS